MENKKENHIRGTHKTKKQIEADIPIIDPKNCPGELIRYFNKRMRADHVAVREIIREELQPVSNWMKITAENRIWLWILTVLLAIDLLSTFAVLFTVSTHLTN